MSDRLIEWAAMFFGVVIPIILLVIAWLFSP